MDIDSLRSGIDAVDAQLVELIGRRGELARQIGEYKRQNKLPVYAPDREAAVIERAKERGAGGPYTPDMLAAIYQTLIGATRALEEPPRVAYLGPEGTFSHQAARGAFGDFAGYLPLREVRDVFFAVEAGEADVGVVPLENSAEGGVGATHDMLEETPLSIVGERVLRVHQNLLARGEITDIRLVLSHPQAMGQCRNWLANHLPGVPLREVASTALAAERAAREAGVAAVASRAAAEVYGLPVAAAAIEDRPENTTRFAVLGRGLPGPTGRDRCSLRFSVKNQPGGLYRALMPFKANDLNMTRIESRPSRRSAGSYTFFVDVEGHPKDAAVAAALAEMEGQTLDFRCLGGYPRADEPVDA